MTSSSSSDSYRVVIHSAGLPIPSDAEAEAKLRLEGYESFLWHDVAGSHYPKHKHSVDECIWVIKGEITFELHTKEGKQNQITLKAGDKIYLPAQITHTAHVPEDDSVTYLVGQKPSKQ